MTLYEISKDAACLKELREYFDGYFKNAIIETLFEKKNMTKREIDALVESREIALEAVDTMDSFTQTAEEKKITLNQAR